MKTDNLKHVSRLTSFLDSSQMIQNPITVFEKYRKEYGDSFTFYFGGAKKTFVTTEPDIIKHILKDNHTNYNKSDIQVKRMAEFQGIGLLNSHGQEWLRQRKLLSKGFSPSYLENLMPLQEELLNEYMENFAGKVLNGPVNVREEMVKFTLRFVGKSLFGKMMSDEVIERLGDIITEIQDFMLRQIVQPYRIPWYKISGQSEKYQKLRREGDQLILDYVIKRRNDDSPENDLLKIILGTPYKDTNELMSDDKVKIETLQLLVAGNETSSNALTWTLYLLSRHPQYIGKIRNEINSIKRDGKIHYEDLRKLTLLNNVLMETLRMYPPFWMIDRIALNDDHINGYTIEKGNMVSVYIYGVQHNEKFWKNPNDFHPERFDSTDQKMHPFAHIPFGGGPRVCIGQNMALMQIFLVLIKIIEQYDFTPVDNKEVEIKPMLILRPDGQVNLRFTKI